MNEFILKDLDDIFNEVENNIRTTTNDKDYELTYLVCSYIQWRVRFFYNKEGNFSHIIYAILEIENINAIQLSEENSIPSDFESKVYCYLSDKSLIVNNNTVISISEIKEHFWKNSFKNVKLAIEQHYNDIGKQFYPHLTFSQFFQEEFMTIKEYFESLFKTYTE